MIIGGYTKDALYIYLWASSFYIDTSVGDWCKAIIFCISDMSGLIASTSPIPHIVAIKLLIDTNVGIKLSNCQAGMLS